MPGQLQRLLNFVRDPLQVFEDAARANPQRVVRENTDAVSQMARDFAAHVANTAPEVEHFTYRPLRRLPSESYPYDARLESATDSSEFSVNPPLDLWRWAQLGYPNVSVHNHPRAISLPSLPGNAATGGAGDLGFLALQPQDSMLGVISRPSRSGEVGGATVATNLGLRPDVNSLAFHYWNARQPGRAVDLERALSSPSDTFHPADPQFRRTMRDLKTLDLVDQGRLRLDTSELPDELLPLVPGGRISNTGASPEELRDVVNWHAKVIDQLRKTGFAVPAAAAAPSVLDQLRAPDQGEGQ